MIVLHARNTRDSLFYGMGDIYGNNDVRKAWAEGNYRAVAMVESKSLEGAYAATQHIEEDWRKGESISLVLSDANEGVRSTSVGDIILDDDDKYWVVAGCGFEPIRGLKHPATVEGM